MPEAGRTPEPVFEMGDDLPYGEAGEANALVGLVGPVREPEPYVPKGAEEEFLFSPTDRPAEPVTAGVPVGPGPDFTRHRLETDDQFKRRVVETLASKPDAPREVKALLKRVAEGM